MTGDTRTDGAPDDEPDEGGRRRAQGGQMVHDHRAAADAAAAAHDRPEVGRATKAVGRRQHQREVTEVSSGGQFATSLAAPSRQDGPAGSGAHT